MVKDITKTIDALRFATVGRCRERLKYAAQKAKGLLKTGQVEEKDEEFPPCKEQYGVTSLMKRKHGL